MSKNLVEEIDELVARAETARSSIERRQALDEAVTKACAAMKRVVRNVTTIARSVTTAHGLSDDGELVFRDQVNALAGGSLAIFASRESLGQYLDATKPLIQDQLDESGRTADQLVAAILAAYDDYMDLNVSASNLVVWCNRLQTLFCRPPGGGAGDGTPPLLPEDDGGGGAQESRVREWISVVAGIVAAVAAVADLFLAARQEKSVYALARFGENERESNLGLYASLLIGATVAQAEDRGLMPAYIAPQIPPESDQDRLTDEEFDAILGKVAAGRAMA